MSRSNVANQSIRRSACTGVNQHVTIYSALLLCLLFILSVASIVRLRGTPNNDPLRKERSDSTAILLWLLVGSAGAIGRDRYAPELWQFKLATIVLVPICVAAVWYMVRLIGAFKSRPHLRSKRNTTVLKPPKIDSSDQK